MVWTFFRLWRTSAGEKAFDLAERPVYDRFHRRECAVFIEPGGFELPMSSLLSAEKGKFVRSGSLKHVTEEMK
jgi:hypothetical protein